MLLFGVSLKHSVEISQSMNRKKLLIIKIPLFSIICLIALFLLEIHQSYLNIYGKFNHKNKPNLIKSLNNETNI